MKHILLPGSKVEIRQSSAIDKKNYYGYISQIEECINEKTLIIGAPISGGQIIPLKLNNEYVFIIYGHKGLYRCKAVIKNRFKKGLIEMLKVELITSLVKIQRREFFRFECVVSFQFSNAEDVWNEGITKDISGGGIRFITNSELKIGDEISIKITLDNKELPLLGKILTQEDSKVELYKYQYRVIFKDIKKSDQDYVIQYIFSQQRKQVRQEKGL